jgi:hypothetical protein
MTYESYAVTKLSDLYLRRRVVMLYWASSFPRICSVGLKPVSLRMPSKDPELIADISNVFCLVKLFVLTTKMKT